MTVREFTEKHPDAIMNMMTPGGYVTVTPVIAAGLLQGKGVDTHPGANECWAKVTAEELLPQEIVQCKEQPEIPNYFYMLSGYVQEHGNETMKFPGTIRAECWRGEHPFEWDDISFEQEIIADNNALNFYVPILFDVYGIFGDAVSKLGEDDTYNVYANYDLDDGIALLLEIMEMPNVIMLLGNHEYMMLQYLGPDAISTEIRRWNRNGNAPIFAAYLKQKAKVQQRIRTYLRTSPTHLELEVNGNRFYMVHGFPGENVHDEVWTRPTMEFENLVPDCRLIIGHTKVLSLIEPQMERLKHAIELEDAGDHLKMLHTPGFTNLDCGCSYDMPIKALACIRLDDMSEFYC